MPELPEVETVRRGLKPLLENARIERVELRRANLRSAFPKHFVESLEGACIKNLRRRAKYILADLDNGYVWLTHLGMSGSFRSIAKGRPFTPEKHDHVIVTLNNGTILAFNDPRRFGRMDSFKKSAESTQAGLRDLGPEPLDKTFTPDVLAQRLKGKKAAIKVALLDQGVVAGVGNIYASEALYAAGIDPRKKAGKISKGKVGELCAAIKKVLGDAVQSGGSTLRNHRQVDGNTGYFQHSFAVYDHAGAPCKNCVCKGKTHIQSIVQAGRTTFFCPVKQR